MTRSPSDSSPSLQSPDELFDSAEWYDRSINWDARLKREQPFLMDVFGPPAEGGLLDAGCGSARHVLALTRAGYRVVGLDASTDMVTLAERVLAENGQQARLVEATYGDAFKAGTAFDGVYCLGNALAAAGSRDAVAQAVKAFTEVLRPGGHLVLHVLNFPKLRGEHPAARGPRMTRHDGRQYLSTRVYQFEGEAVDVVNVTIWEESGTWRQWARSGRLFAVEPELLLALITSAGLVIEHCFGNYARERFDPAKSDDLLIVARRTAGQPA